MRRRYDKQRRARHQSKLLLGTHEASEFNVFMLRDGHVVDTRNDQAQLAGMRLLETQKVLEKFATAFVRIDATRVEEIRRIHPLRLAKLSFDCHSYNSSR